MVTANQWRTLLRRARRNGAFAGVSPQLYPRNLRTFFRFQRAIRAVPHRYPEPEPLPLPVFETWLRDRARRYPTVHYGD
jgi:hypothetical protein